MVFFCVSSCEVRKMKKILGASAAMLFLLVMVSACASYGSDEPIEALLQEDDFIEPANYDVPTGGERVMDMLFFSSLEDFLTAHRTLRDGGDITDLVAEWQASFTDMDLADVIVNAGLASLETFYLPVGIPEEFQIHRVDINESGVGIWYLHKDELAFEDADWFEISRSWDFLFSFTHVETPGNMRSILQQHNMSEEDLVDGRLFLEPDLFVWAYGRVRMLLYIPMSLVSDNVADMLRLTEVKAVNLLDAEMVETLLTP